MSRFRNIDLPKVAGLFAMLCALVAIVWTLAQLLGCSQGVHH